MTDQGKTWMAAWCWLVIVFGAVLASAVTPATDAPARLAMGIISGEATQFDSAALRFAFALMGALSIGWGFTILAIVRAGASPAVWRGVTAAVIGWYVIDSAASVATGFPMNAASNTLLLGLYLAAAAAGGVLRARA